MIITVGDARVVVHGTGGTLPPVVAIHDLGGTARRWDAVAARLAAWGHPVAAVDLPLSASTSLGDLGAQVASVADHLGWWPVVVGHGFGAAVSLRLAADRPGAARAQVWVAGGTIDLSVRFADWPTAAAALGPSPFFSPSLLRLGHPDWEEAAIEGVLADVPLPASVHQHWLAQLWEQHPADLYPLVRTPVVVVVATPADGTSATRWALVSSTEVAAAEAGLLRVRVSPVAGDEDLPSDQPDEIAAIVARAAADPPGT